jgi:hypothetical protein
VSSYSKQIHTTRSIDQEFAHLTKDLELTPKQQQQQQVRPLLQEQHDKIQALLDKNRTLRGRSLRLRLTLSATKRTAKFMLC